MVTNSGWEVPILFTLGKGEGFVSLPLNLEILLRSSFIRGNSYAIIPYLLEYDTDSAHIRGLNSTIIVDKSGEIVV